MQRTRTRIDEIVQRFDCPPAPLPPPAVSIRSPPPPPPCPASATPAVPRPPPPPPPPVARAPLWRHRLWGRGRAHRAWGARSRRAHAEPLRDAGAAMPRGGWRRTDGGAAAPRLWRASRRTTGGTGPGPSQKWDGDAASCGRASHGVRSRARRRPPPTGLWRPRTSLSNWSPLDSALSTALSPGANRHRFSANRSAQERPAHCKLPSTTGGRASLPPSVACCTVRCPAYDRQWLWHLPAKLFVHQVPGCGRRVFVLSFFSFPVTHFRRRYSWTISHFAVRPPSEHPHPTSSARPPDGHASPDVKMGVWVPGVCTPGAPSPPTKEEGGTTARVSHGDPKPGQPPGGGGGGGGGIADGGHPRGGGSGRGGAGMGSFGALFGERGGRSPGSL